MMKNMRSMKTGMKSRMIEFPNDKIKMLQFPELNAKKHL